MRHPARRRRLTGCARDTLLQAMVNEGLVDPVNGLDDFRIVIGDGDGAK